MSEFDKDIKIGDLIYSYHKGVHRVVGVERRFVTKDLARRYPSTYKKVGDEFASLVSYETVLDSNYKPVGKSLVKSCDVSYCKKLNKQLVMSELNQITDRYHNLLEMLLE